MAFFTCACIENEEITGKTAETNWLSFFSTFEQGK
jgi:hypothetical protein